MFKLLSIIFSYNVLWADPLGCTWEPEHYLNHLELFRNFHDKRFRRVTFFFFFSKNK